MRGTANIVGYMIDGEPIYKFSSEPSTVTTNQGAYDSGAIGCSCSGAEFDLPTLLIDCADLAKDFDELADRVRAQMQEMDARGFTEPAELMLNAAAQRSQLLKELAITSEAAIQLRALIGTAAHVLS